MRFLRYLQKGEFAEVIKASTFYRWTCIEEIQGCHTCKPCVEYYLTNRKGIKGVVPFGMTATVRSNDPYCCFFLPLVSDNEEEKLWELLSKSMVEPL